MCFCLPPLLSPVVTQQLKKKLTKCFISPCQTAGFCAGSVYGDLNAQPEAQVSCEMFKVQVQEAVKNDLFSESIVFFYESDCYIQGICFGVVMHETQNSQNVFITYTFLQFLEL